MAKFESIIDLKGTIQGMTFYKTKDGTLVRKKGGVDKKRIMTDPAFVRTRENGMEFGHNAKMAQLVRRALANYLGLAKDSKVSSRLSKTMNEVKNMDAQSKRGERKVWVGLESEAGKNALKGFDFNLRSPFASVFRATYSLDITTGVLTIPDLIPLLHLGVPQGATHVGLRVGVSNVDFTQGIFTTEYGTETRLPLTEDSSALVLEPNGMPTGDGFVLYFCLVCYYQELNGDFYTLKNNAFNSLVLLEVL